MDNVNDSTGFFTKLAVYCGGVLLGLGARLAIIHKEKNLTMKEVLSQSTVAFASAYLTWAILQTYAHPEMANVCAVIVGRFGDSILMMAYRAIRTAAKEFLKF